MNSNRNKRKVALASALIAASSITSQAAVTATSVFDGTNSVITLNFTEGIYTLGVDALDGKSAALDWIGPATGFADSSQSAGTATNGLLSSRPLTFNSITYQVSGGKGSYRLLFDEGSAGETITGGSLVFTLPGSVASAGHNLRRGGFSGVSNELTVASVPEPSGAALLLLGSISMLARRKR